MKSIAIDINEPGRVSFAKTIDAPFEEIEKLRNAGSPEKAAAKVSFVKSYIEVVLAGQWDGFYDCDAILVC
jgi:hypothetical protein